MRLRCGVAGLGRGKSFVQALSQIEDVEVVAVCDPNRKALEGFSGLSQHTEYERFLDEKLDVVAVISPGPIHAQQSLAALERGMHVLCETPCVYSVEEAQAVVAAVEKTGLKYMLAENYIWAGWCAALLRMAEGGEFGDVIYAEGDYTHDCRDIMLADEDGYVPYAERDQHPDAKKTWRATDLPPLKYCSHTLGPLLWIMRDRVGSGYGLSIRGKGAPDLCPTDLESALLQTQKGAIIRLTNGFAVAHPMGLYYHIVGTRGSVMILRTGELTAKWWSETGASGKGWQEFPPERLERPDGRDGLVVMLEEFINSIRNDTKPPIDVHESMDMTLPGIIAHQSGLNGGVKMEVPDSRGWA